MALRRISDWVLEQPFVYAAWQAPFPAQQITPGEQQGLHRTTRTVLGVGCGPGTNAARFEGVDYVGVDINERYLAIARSRYPGRFVQADLAMSPDLSGLGRLDTILVNSFLH